MRILVNRISSATVLALILAIATTIIISSPTAMALTINTTVTADANPNPVHVGNEILLEININPDLPSGYYYQDVVITVTGPDATVSNLGPFSTDQFGQLFYFFVPTLVGTYSLNFSYPGEILNGNTYTSCEVGPIFVDSVPDLFRVHNLDTDLNYTSIQSAIDAPETLTGHTIFVDSGTYNESVEITKSITLIGEDGGNTIIDGGGRPATVVYAEGVNGVEISGFTIKNGYNGIHLTDCPYSNVYGNTLINNTYSGIFVNDSFNCSISRNNITNSDEAIALVYSSNNFITQNRVVNNQLGISLNASTDNSIFHNSIVENVAQVSITDSFNTWDDGYPSGGNYWSDYNGIDADSDGIGDTPYFIDENNQDNYPLTKPFGIIDYVFDITAGNTIISVGISSNSSISEFDFSESSLQVSFNVTGPTGTTGFCNITVPENLLWGDFSVYLNEELLVEGLDYTRTYNGTHNIFHITYSHSSHLIEIAGTHVIPEHFSLIVMSLLLAATLLIIINRKRQLRLWQRQ